MNRFFIIFFLCSFFSFPTLSIYAQKQPAWVEEPYKSYPNTEFLAEVGEGSSQNAADISAYANLSRIFGITATSDTRSTKSYQSSGQSANLKTEDAVSARHKMLNTKILGRFYDKKKNIYYAVAVMHIKETIVLLQQTINENEQTIVDGYLERIKNEQDPIKKYSLIKLAVALSSDNDAYRQQHEVLKGGPLPGPAYTSQALRTQMDQAAKAVSFGVVTADPNSPVRVIIRNVLSDVKMTVDDQNARYIFKETLDFSFIDTGYNIIIANFFLQLNLTNPSGEVLRSFTFQGKASGETKEKAIATAKITLAKEIEQPLAQQFSEFLDSI